MQSLEAQDCGDPNRNFWTPASPPKCYYNIHFQIDTLQRILSGTEVVRITNPNHQTIYRLALDWSVNKHQTLGINIKGRPVSLELDPTQTNVTSPMLFDLPEALVGGSSIELELMFSQSIPQVTEQKNILFTKWFPRIWWGIDTQDDFDVFIDVPSTYTIATSGRFDATSHSYHAENVRTFGLFFGRGLHVAEAMAGDVLVRCLYSEKAEPCAQLILHTAVDVITFYRQFLGLFPYKILNIVPGADKPMGGYNAATSISVIHGEERMSEKPEIHWQWITAHEIGHMYWGEYVMEKDSPGWLWIGLGIYGDREYIRARGLSLEMHRGLMNRYIEGVRNHLNTTVAITPDQLNDIDFDFNNIVTHGKGFSIISALANHLGSETFNRIYLRCLKDYGGKRLGAEEFQSICEAESGENLNWFFDAWLHSNQFLSYQVTSQHCIKSNDKYISTISVERFGTMKMPVPVVCYFEDGTSQQIITDRLLDNNILQISSKAPLNHVQIDPNNELAMVVPPPELTIDELTKKIVSLPWTGADKDALIFFKKAQQMQPKSEGIWFKLGLILYDGEYYEQALDAFKHTVAVSDSTSKENYFSFVWQGHILDILGHRDEAIQLYKTALSIDVGQEMRHDQYGIVINHKWVEERLKKPFLR